MKDEELDMLIANAEYESQQLKDYITNLQEEVNKLTAESTEWESKCYDLQEEYEKLKELCDKYEEEQKTTYEIWKKDINLYNSIVDRLDKAREILKDTSVDMPETLLIEVIDYAVHILQGSDEE